MKIADILPEKEIKEAVLGEYEKESKDRGRKSKDRGRVYTLDKK
jgi:hypothetical protein